MKLFVGVVSKNTVDAVIEYANDNNVIIGLIPSRRQVDYISGYVNNWTTKTFSEYVNSKTKNVIIERDHGGEGQGKLNAYASYVNDAKYFDAIHIDPWKYKPKRHNIKFNELVDITIYNLEYCYENNKNLWFEVGTEESIFKMNDVDVLKFITYIKNNSNGVFDKIKYVVIQSGTRLYKNSNIGNYDKKRLLNMIKVVHNFGLKTKIHNGDYLSSSVIKEHFELGVDSINIAPEFGYIETSEYLSNMNKNQIEEFYKLCYENNQWKKWVDEEFEPEKNKIDLIKFSGHYVFSDSKFKKLKSELSHDIDSIIKNNIKKRIGEIIG